MYLVLFTLINFWTIFVSVPHDKQIFAEGLIEVLQIHDSDMITGHPLENVINGPAHHTLHHLYFTCNYGQVNSYCPMAGPT
jgi:Delta7-sterol 5-desaturase